MGETSLPGRRLYQKIMQIDLGRQIQLLPQPVPADFHSFERDVQQLGDLLGTEIQP